MQLLSFENHIIKARAGRELLPIYLHLFLIRPGYGRDYVLAFDCSQLASTRLADDSRRASQVVLAHFIRTRRGISLTRTAAGFLLVIA